MAMATDFPDLQVINLTSATFNPSFNSNPDLALKIVS
jgi:hypothetical protein